MNNIEKYIKARQPELDQIEGPENPERLWEMITETIHANSEDQAGPKDNPNRVLKLLHNRYVQWAVAASIGLAIGMSSWLFQPNAQPGNDGKIPSSILAQYAPQLADQEKAYVKLISEKENEIGLKNLDPEDFKSYFRELETLDILWKEYLKDAEQELGNEQFIQTLIKFYERKIRILELLSYEIEKRNRYEEKTEFPL